MMTPPIVLMRATSLRWRDDDNDDDHDDGDDDDSVAELRLQDYFRSGQSRGNVRMILIRLCRLCFNLSMISLSRSVLN